jgi:hypothetical protein
MSVRVARVTPGQNLSPASGAPRVQRLQPAALVEAPETRSSAVIWPNTTAERHARYVVEPLGTERKRTYGIVYPAPRMKWPDHCGASLAKDVLTFAHFFIAALKD